MFVADSHPFSAPERVSATPPLASSAVLIGLAFAGFALWVLRALEREREDRADIEAQCQSLAEAESTSLADLKVELGL